jgi:membrane-bound metal-dependent hydrolase YbcI (DUF457 family)
MSSFLGHSIVGVVMANQHEKKNVKELVFVSLFFIFLSCSPDIDYLINYLRGESFAIRYTHSIGYVIFVTLMALVLRRFVFRSLLGHLPMYLFFLVPFSHLILDFLVGVHPNPYLYPFTDRTIVSPIGVLPSSGSVSLTNYYFWRNLFIELLIFVPFAFLSLPRTRAYLLKVKGMLVVTGMILMVGLVIGISLER